jgi:hypothetical protein
VSLYFFLKELLVVNGTALRIGTPVLADYDLLVEMLDDYQKGRLFCICKIGSIDEEFVMTKDSLAWPNLMEFVR